MPETTVKKFRMSEFIKDGYLAKAVRAEIQDLRGKELELAEEAITEVATSGIAGTFDELLAEYRRAIRRVLHPERKIVRNAKIDRALIKNAQLAALLDRELEDVTREELARANAAVKAILDAVAEISPEGKPGEERFVEHAPSEICKMNKKHSTLGECGYFKDPAAWPDIFRNAVREAIAG
jgi:hypothetical protein